MDRNQLDAAIRSANVNGTRDELLLRLRYLPDSTRFDSLFALASDTQTNAPALDAATFLLELNPKCPLKCVDVVRNIATSDWFISIEELPWYVVKQFGLTEVLDAVADVRSEPLSEIQLAYLRRTEYWVKLAPNYQIIDRIMQT